MRTPLRLLCGLLAASLIPATAFAQSTLCWTHDVGTLMAQGGNSTTPAVNLPFAFPLPGGGSTTQIRANTNGYIWLNGTNGRNDQSPTVAEMLAQDARILAGWSDLECNPGDDPSHGLFVNTTIPNRVVVTWIGNDLSYSIPVPNIVHMQVQMFPNGSFTITHRRVDQYFGTSTDTKHDMIVGVTLGSGATDPGAVDFTAGAVMSPTESTIYEHFENVVNNPNDPRDLDTIPTLFFFPAGTGYNVTPTNCGAFAHGVARGVGCPPDNAERGFVFEKFTGVPDLVGKSLKFERQPLGGYRVTQLPSLVWEGNYTNRIDNDLFAWPQRNHNDGMSVAYPLGFSASFWDNLPSTELYVCSNGRVYLAPSPHIAATTSPTAMNSSSCVLALFNSNLDCSPAVVPMGSGLYVDRFPAQGNTPARCVVTFDAIPEYTGTPPTANTVTVQAQFFANGDVLWSMPSFSLTRAGYVGFFRGNQEGSVSDTTDSVDLSVATMAPGLAVEAPMRPMTHDADEFILGTTPSAYAAIPSGALATVMHVGIDQTNVPLDPIGMIGCSAYTMTLVGTVPMLQAGRTASFTFGTVPNVTTLPGLLFTTQAFSLVPGINPFSIVASNGWDSTVGI